MCSHRHVHRISLSLFLSLSLSLSVSYANLARLNRETYLKKFNLIKKIYISILEKSIFHDTELLATEAIPWWFVQILLESVIVLLHF